MFGWRWPSLLCTDCRKCSRFYSSLLKCVAADVKQAPAAAFHGWPVSAVGRHNSTLKLSMSDTFQNKIYCVIWLTFYVLESVGCYSGKEGDFLYGPTGVVFLWLRGLATVEVKKTHTSIIQCVLYKVILYIVWPWLPGASLLLLSVGYQSKMVAFVLANKNYKN